MTEYAQKRFCVLKDLLERTDRLYPFGRSVFLAKDALMDKRNGPSGVDVL